MIITNNLELDNGTLIIKNVPKELADKFVSSCQGTTVRNYYRRIKGNCKRDTGVTK